ncbi:MAG: DUF2235 domain-containing protein [Geminicoccaceae bacterium]
MAKSLLVAFDGTWNTPESDTNIHKLARHALNTDAQRVWYDPGVGSAGELDSFIGGNFGVGLSGNVCEAYRFILEHYAPGDDLYVIGFSRGAFTARSLCGFMRLVGRLGSADDIDDAYVYYRIHEPGEDDAFYERWFKPSSLGPIPVRFLGVFDTVGALGLPFEIRDTLPDDSASPLQRVGDRLWRWLDDLGDQVRRPIKGFHDTSLGDRVETACHALAIDEPRGIFNATLWTDAPGQALKLGGDGDGFTVRQSVEQLWFAGSHVDCGGGATDTPSEERLSNLSLHWMAEHAARAGLQFEPGFLDDLRVFAAALPCAAQHDPLTERWQNLHAKTGQPVGPRPIGNDARKAADPAGGVYPPVHTHEAIHASVRARLGKTVSVNHAERGMSEAVYAPKNVVNSMIQASS